MGFCYTFAPMYNVGDTVMNSKTGKLYIVVGIEDQYLTLVPDGEEPKADSEIAISMHQDFVELVPNDEDFEDEL